MSRSDTEKAKAPQLSARQVRVVTSLMAGETVVAAAKSAGVSRETVHRWWREDFEFQATYNRGRRELLETIQCRLLALADQATETVKKAVEQGDTKTALVVLKGLGMLPDILIRIGAEDPHVLRDDAEIAKKEAQQARRDRRLFTGLGVFEEEN